MLGQTFAFPDLGTVLLLVGLEILLSADNAIVLAILVRHLPEAQQQRALFYGLAGAFVFRFVAIVTAVWLKSMWWMQLLGAGYLIYLAAKSLLRGGGEKHVRARQAGFWATVFYVELTDIAFAIDSVLVAVATEPRPEKIWVVYLGAMMGVIMLRWAAGIFLRLLHRFPVLETMAYILVGWAGLKLLFLAGHTFQGWYAGTPQQPGFQASMTSWPAWPHALHLPEMPIPMFWVGVGLIVAWGLASCLKARPSESKTAAESVNDLGASEQDPS